MSELIDAFNLLIRKKQPPESLLVPLLRWCSAREADIELCQRVNKRFFGGNHKVYILEVALSNTLSHFIPYPKKGATDNKLDFFYKDLCKFFGWTLNEFEKNKSVIDIDSMKEIIARNFGYDNRERKLLGLAKLGGYRANGKKQ